MPVFDSAKDDLVALALELELLVIMYATSWFPGGMLGGLPSLARHIRRTKGGLNSNLHAVCGGGGDFGGAAPMIEAFLSTKVLLVTKHTMATGSVGADRRIEACIPSK